MSETVYDDTEPLRKGTAKAIMVHVTLMNAFIMGAYFTIASDALWRIVLFAGLSFTAFSCLKSFDEDSIHHTVWGKATGMWECYDGETGEWSE